MKNDNKLGTLNVAVMYVGAIMGAGFASGRETWQFFGVFGEMGRVGAVIFAVLFLAVGLMVSYIARKLGTNDLGKLIVPGCNERLESFVGYFMAAILATVLIIMTAAGGALLRQQFGLNHAIGGMAITALVIITVLGDFERISKVFKYIMPVLCVVMVATCIAVIAINPQGEQIDAEITPSPAAPNWLLAALLYVSYNVMALISIVANATLNAKNGRTAIRGTVLGGVFLGILAVLILLTVQCDMPFSQITDMPVLGYAGRISREMGMVYTAILFFAIYSAATGNFYGFTTKLKEGPNKKKIIVLAAGMGFALGLAGFKNIVEYVSPVVGYIGVVIITMLIFNFISIWKKEREKMNKEPFPKPLVRVTGGKGGEATLIMGSEKCALHDCGMACFNKELIANIEEALGDRDLDYVILSHSHYDHMGALPYVIRRWPDVKVCAAKKAEEVFKRKGALDMILSMGKTAAQVYGRDPDEIIVEGLRVDRVLENGDVIDLGEEKILAFETKGHTDCSMSYLIQPEGILIASESTGVLENEEKLHTSVLKSFEESFESANFLKLLPYKHVLIPHYGMLPEKLRDKYFDMYIAEAQREKALIEGCIKKGMSLEEIFEEHKKIYWNEFRAKNNPYRAYKMNAEITIKLLMKEA